MFNRVSNQQWCRRGQTGLARRLITNFIIALIPVTSLMGGCATKHTPAVWLDASFDELQTAFGNPTGVFINPMGNRVYAFALAPDHAPSDGSPSDDSNEPATPLVYGNAELILQGVDCIVTFELQNTSVSRWNWNETGCAKVKLPLPYETGALAPMP